MARDPTLGFPLALRPWQEAPDLRYMRKEWLEKRIKAGRTLRQIADESGASGATLVNWARHHGLPQPRDPREYLDAKARRTYGDRAWLAAQCAAGLTIAEIAAECRASQGTISQWLRRHGLKAPRAERKRKPVTDSDRPVAPPRPRAGAR